MKKEKNNIIIKSFKIKIFILLILFGGITMIFSCSSSSQTKKTDQKYMQSPQWRDGGFHNTLERNDASIWTILGNRLSMTIENTYPESPMPAVKPEKTIFDTNPESGLRITWLGHSTALIEIDGYKVLTDPMWSDRASPISFIGPKRFFEPPLSIDDLPALDAVVISHDHFDHLDKESVLMLKDKTSLFAAPLRIGEYLLEWGIDKEKIIERDWWGAIELDRLTLTAVPARHFSGRSITTIYGNKTLWAGWVIKGPEHSVYFSGDTAMFPGFKEIGNRLGPFDVTLMESGAYNSMWPDVHLGPEQAVRAHRMVKGGLLIPIHWGTFDLAMHSWTEPAERMLAASQEQDVDIMIPMPGQSIDIGSLPELVRWWPDLPWQKADEAPVISTGLEPDISINNSRELMRAEVK